MGPLVVCCLADLHHRQNLNRLYPEGAQGLIDRRSGLTAIASLFSMAEHDVQLQARV